MESFSTSYYNYSACSISTFRNTDESCTFQPLEQSALDEMVASRFSSSGQPLEVKSKRQAGRKCLLTQHQFRSITVKALAALLDPEPWISESIKSFSNFQLAELIESVGKRFWDTVLFQNGKCSIRDLRYFFDFSFKSVQ
ncbi:Hypothetical_protein [Hexamita inflata]|uniref:Hypothetical_protein n=1 Tax=Hexamita inflata TaxID=28002 RepID=A0AA86V288_9EUKA|nr:Hypothetical protein HINF_LOCUS65519 [Hexamita inflata]